jgi:hypothetical protein
VTRGKVLEHVTEAFIVDVEFAVQPAGRAKVIEQKRKNVHAFVRGIQVRIPAHVIEEIFRTCDMEEVTYNPYIAGYFYRKRDSKPVFIADQVIIKNEKVYALNIA